MPKVVDMLNFEAGILNLAAWVVNGDDTLVSVGNGGEGLLGEVDLVAGAARAEVYEAHADGLAARASRAVTRNLACLPARGSAIIEPTICRDNEVVWQEAASVVAVACRCYICNQFHEIKHQTKMYTYVGTCI